MNVFIPTYKRLDRQPTLSALAGAGVTTTLVVRPEESTQALALADRVQQATGTAVNVFTLPDGIQNLAQTRQVLMNTFEDVIFMMDDDLAFAVRGKREDNPLYLSPAQPEDIQQMVRDVFDHCRAEGLCGVGMREGNNRKEDEVEYVTRMSRAWAVHMPTFREIGARFEDHVSIEDFDITLQFLLAGKRNVVLNKYTTNQAGSNTAGGCSEYRDMTVQRQAAEALAAKFPEFVTVVEKTTKTSWGGGTRHDVRIQWKKAYKKGCGQ